MSGVRAALSFPDFRRFVLGRFFATLAWQMLGVAVGWQVYSITRDPLDLGLVGLAQFLPFFALVLPGGQLADRVDRRLVIVTAYIIEAICAVVLLAFTLSGSSDVKWVFFAMALFGAGRALWMPSGQAMTVNLVPAEVFPAAVAFNSSLFEAAVIVGPAVGGLLYAFSEAQLQTSGALLVYVVCLVLLLLVVVLMWRVRPVRASGGQRPVSMSEMFEGLRFVFSRRPILGAISLDLFAVLFGGATALLPMFAADILHVGPEGLGALRTAPGIGAGVTALLLARRPIAQHAGRWMFGGVAAFGVATIVFGLSTWFWVSFAALVVVGAGDMVSVVIRMSIVQLETPDDMRGRVGAVNSVFIGASNQIGEFESGVVAAWLGPVAAVVLGGLGTLAVVGLWMRLFPSLAQRDRLDPGDGGRTGHT